jgi:hypothetical protein
MHVETTHTIMIAWMRLCSFAVLDDMNALTNMWCRLLLCSLLATLDTDRDGAVSYTEFKRWMNKGTHTQFLIRKLLSNSDQNLLSKPNTKTLT